MEQEQRLITLETKQAFIDDTVEQLSGTIAAQQRQIDDLTAAVKLLHQQLKSLQDNPGVDAGDEPPPPHY